MSAPRKCSACHQPGHTTRTCEVRQAREYDAKGLADFLAKGEAALEASRAALLAPPPAPEPSDSAAFEADDSELAFLRERVNALRGELDEARSRYLAEREIVDEARKELEAAREAKDDAEHDKKMAEEELAEVQASLAKLAAVARSIIPSGGWVPRPCPACGMVGYHKPFCAVQDLERAMPE